MDAEKYVVRDGKEFPSSVADELRLELNPAEAKVVTDALNLLQLNRQEQQILEGRGGGFITDERGLGTEADIQDMLEAIESAPITHRTK